MPHPPAAAPPRGLFHALARFATARPRLLLAVTVAFLAAAVVLGGGVADRLRSGGYYDPAADSTYASQVLDREFPASRPNLVLLADAPGGVDATAAATDGRALAERLAKEPGVSGVTSYWQTRNPVLRARDGREALIVARVEGDETDSDKILDRIAPHYQGSQGSLEVRLGGTTAIRHDIESWISEDLVRAESIALPITLLILVLVFGSAVAALLPVGIGIIAILGTNAVLRIITSATDVSVFALNLTTALGLGLAIDYALLIVRRYREELAAGRDTREAIAATLNTAGRTVLFSAATVAVSLAAMLVFPLYFLRSMAYAGMSVVVLAAGAALVVLPALLAVLGRRIDSLDVRRLIRRRRPAPTAAEAAAAATTAGAPWARLAAVVMRRAPFFAAGTLAVLVLLGLPFLRVHFGTGDDRQLPTSSDARVVQQHIRDGFAGSPAGVIEIVTENAPADAVGPYAQRLSRLPNVLRVDSAAGQYTKGSATGPAEAGRTSGSTSYLTLVPSVEDVSRESAALVRDVRELDAPFATHAAGTAAALTDTQSAIGRGLPWAVAIIVLATLALVFLLTGSVLVPLQAVLLNALSLTAMLGAVVWVFQDGHLAGVLGFTPTGTIETSLPVLMFCMAFGLSMDYGVFLLSRIKEEHEHSGDHRAAVVEGIRRTGGIITAAAVILAVVMVSIGTSRIGNTKMLGLGVALAILMDAMVVRTLLVPAVLALTGKAAWWAPGPLRRLHDRFGISEGPSAPAAPEQRQPPVLEPVAAGDRSS